MPAYATRSSHPSTFEALFRRSKFASHTPSIAQVYTAPTASRARGDFGFKHPFPTGRRALRAQYVTVQRADGYWGGMLWASGETRARWVSQMEELDAVVEPDISNGSTGRAQNDEWYEESEFTRALDASTHSRSSFDPNSLGGTRSSLLGEERPYKNWDRLGRKAFERWLREVRGLQGEFRRWVLDRRKEQLFALQAGENPKLSDPAGQSDILPNTHRPPTNSHIALDTYYHKDPADDFYPLAQSPSALVEMDHFFATRPPPTSPAHLLAIPHPVSGLAYARPSRLQVFLNTKPQRGVVLGELPAEPSISPAVGRRRRGEDGDTTFLVGLRGHAARVSRRHSGGRIAPFLYQGRDPLRNEPRFRIWQSTLLRPPEVVRPQDVGMGLYSRGEEREVGVLRMELREVWQGEKLRFWERPGSPGWVANDQRTSEFFSLRSTNPPLGQELDVGGDGIAERQKVESAKEAKEREGREKREKRREKAAKMLNDVGALLGI
ncbi:hypothetical protein DACRYDRAFT_117160 [Dacryopinax primogenitus]|uniref:Uncharacterized protein n=1 Tax=Dacryopinax primogenitus (strain DJM 731) TaxID=1858805 RepID=M5FT45_DACPD|nr:uncharacterized protein DACRYDRAFT_117160 [Dacryopinax primogenitus]EJU00736.1 hypothetical protein DACRYDRAFT_117160 [Dacryopinax primogenitus]